MFASKAEVSIEDILGMIPDNDIFTRVTPQDVSTTDRYNGLDIVPSPSGLKFDLERTANSPIGSDVVGTAFDDFFDFGDTLDIMLRIFKNVQQELEPRGNVKLELSKVDPLRRELGKLANGLMTAIRDTEKYQTALNRSDNQKSIFREGIKFARREISDAAYIELLDCRAGLGSLPDFSNSSNNPGDQVFMRFDGNTKVQQNANESRKKPILDFIYTNRRVESAVEGQEFTERKLELKCQLWDEWGNAQGFQATFLQKILKDLRISLTPILSIHFVRDDKSWSTIRNMISEGDLEGIRRKFGLKELSKADVSSEGRNLLHAAIVDDEPINPTIIEFLVQEGVDVNHMCLVEDDQGSPLDYLYLQDGVSQSATFRKTRLSCARMLLRAGAEINYEHRFKGSIRPASFSEVCDSGDIEDFQMLLNDSYKSNVDLNNLKTEDDKSVLLNFLSRLEAAAEANNGEFRTPESCVDIVNLLLAHGARIDQRSEPENGSVLHKVFTGVYDRNTIRQPPKVSKAEAIQLAVVKALIRAGADIHATDAIMERHPEGTADLYVGTVTEAAYMAGLQRIWWEALSETVETDIDFDKELFLRRQSALRGLTLAEYKRHLRYNWLLFMPLLYLDCSELDGGDDVDLPVLPESPDYSLSAENSDEDDDEIEEIENDQSPEPSEADKIPVWDPAEDALLRRERDGPYMKIIIGFPVESMKPLGFLSEIIFRLNNCWIFSTYTDENGTVVARPHVFQDDVLDSDREELEPGWIPDIDIQGLYLKRDEKTPKRWLLEELVKLRLEKEVKSAVKYMLDC